MGRNWRDEELSQQPSCRYDDKIFRKEVGRNFTRLRRKVGGPGRSPEGRRSLQQKRKGYEQMPGGRDCAAVLRKFVAPNGKRFIDD